jgi:hypothetical protein
MKNITCVKSFTTGSNFRGVKTPIQTITQLETDSLLKNTFSKGGEI